MEMMGLTIIVVLLAFALLFVVRFVLLAEPDDTKESFVESKLAHSFVSTLLDTTAVDCKKFSVEELLKDCREGIYTDPPLWDDDALQTGNANGIGTIECDGTTPNSCTFALTMISDILNETLGKKLNIDYEFILYSDSPTCETVKNPSNVIFHTGPTCPGTKKQVCQPVPTAVTDIQLRLDICNRLAET